MKQKTSVKITPKNFIEGFDRIQKKAWLYLALVILFFSVLLLSLGVWDATTVLKKQTANYEAQLNQVSMTYGALIAEIKGDANLKRVSADVLRDHSTLINQELYALNRINPIVAYHHMGSLYFDEGVVAQGRTSLTTFDIPFFEVLERYQIALPLFKQIIWWHPDGILNTFPSLNYASVTEIIMHNESSVKSFAISTLMNALDHHSGEILYIPTLDSNEFLWVCREPDGTGNVFIIYFEMPVQVNYTSLLRVESLYNRLNTITSPQWSFKDAHIVFHQPLIDYGVVLVSEYPLSSILMRLVFLMLIILLMMISLFGILRATKRSLDKDMFEPMRALADVLPDNFKSNEQGDSWNDLLEYLSIACERYNYSGDLAQCYMRVRLVEGEAMIDSLQLSKSPINAQEKLSNARFFDMIDEDSRWHFQNALKDSEHFKMPVKLIVKLRSQENLYWGIYLAPKFEKESLYWDGIVYDATDVKLFEHALIEEKQFIEDLFRLSGVIFCVADREGNLVRYNEVFSSYFDETLLDNVYPSKNLWNCVLSEKESNSFFERIHLSIEHHMNYHIENSITGKNGEQRYISWYFSAITTDGESVVLMTGSDVTDRVRLNQELMTINSSLISKNEEIEKIVYNQKQLFNIFEKMRFAKNSQNLFDLLDRELRKIINYRNLFFFIKPQRDSNSYDVYDAVSDFTEREKSMYFVEQKGVLGRILSTQEIFCSGDVKKDPDYIVHHPAVHSLMLVPIMYTDFMWGVIGLDSEKYHAFTEIELEMVKMYTTHIALHMEEVSSRLELKNEAKNLKGLHHAVSLMMAQREKASNAQVLVEAGLINDLSIYAYDGEELMLLAESNPTTQEKFGVIHASALIEEAVKGTNLITRYIKSQQLYHHCHPITKSGIIMGVLYTLTTQVLSDKQMEVMALVANQLALVWRLNDMIEASEHDALVDPLTNMWNRRYILRRIEEEHQRMERYPSYASLIMIDMADFKKVNDTYGHLVGDEVLIEVASLLKSCIRETDDIGRYGGDEFLVLLPVTDRQEANGCINRMKALLESTVLTPHKIVVKADFGLVCIPSDLDNLMEGIYFADQHMYSAKKKGKKQQADLLGQ